jgi:CheY-like chemotaxis protein
MHGGSIHADSGGLGKGASFSVLLPMEVKSVGRERTGADSKEAGHVPPPAAFEPALAGVDILVVEDEPDAQAMIATILGQHGARVRVAGTAGSAVSSLRDHWPDLLLSDIALPDADGYSLMRTGVEMGSTRSVKLNAVALTAYAGSQARERALSAGFVEHLAKPIVPDDLVRVLSSVLAMPR